MDGKGFGQRESGAEVGMYLLGPRNKGGLQWLEEGEREQTA